METVVIETTSETLQVYLASLGTCAPICRKCTNRTSPECPKHPMHTITLHSRIKFSRLDSNQRPFVYQTNALNHLSYVRMLEPPVGFEPTTSCLQNKCSTNWAKEACCTPARIRILTKSFGEIYATITPQTCISQYVKEPFCNTKKKPRTFL